MVSHIRANLEPSESSISDAGASRRYARDYGGNMKRIVSTLGVVLGAILAALVMATPAEATTYTKVVRYGPFTIPGGSEEVPGELPNQLRLAVQRPCLDCYITSFKPDLVYADGTTASMETGPMLHHAVLTSQFRSDATCGTSWLGLAGERFFASGDERTSIAFPSGYGYRVRWYDSWNLLVDLMNHDATQKTVYFQIRVTYRPSWENVRPLKPVWLDIDQCGDSKYSIPAGFSDTHWDWSVNVPGNIVAMIGHVHGHGIAVEATNESKGGELICRSKATPDPDDLHRILKMSTCVDDPVARVQAGQIVRLHSQYQSSHAADDVMGIMLAYINRL
jgi:Stress up-regulated Nod 19